MNFSIQGIYNWYRNTLRNPKYRWWLILGTVAYLLSPIDLIPDFLPFAGVLDDGAILMLLVTEVSQLMSDRLRARKPDETQPTQSDATVDVDAVSMK